MIILENKCWQFYQVGLISRTLAQKLCKSSQKSLILPSCVFSQTFYPKPQIFLHRDISILQLCWLHLSIVRREGGESALIAYFPIRTPILTSNLALKPKLMYKIKSVFKHRYLKKKEVHKLGRCDSFLQSENITHWPTDRQG